MNTTEQVPDVSTPLIPGQPPKPAIDIALWGASVLGKIAQPVSRDEDVRGVIEHMHHVMNKWDGAGIAAPQIGVSKAIFLWRNPETGEVKACINPRITQQEGSQKDHEGCLSIPGVSGPIVRSQILVLEFEDENRQMQTIVAKDYLARVFQHEVDHLWGMTIAERVGAVHKGLWKNRLKTVKEWAQKTVVKPVRTSHDAE